jgi:hypothetical protein
MTEVYLKEHSNNATVNFAVWIKSLKSLNQLEPNLSRIVNCHFITEFVFRVG